MIREASRHYELPLRQTTRLYYRITEIRDRTAAGKDISASSWSPRVRLYTSPAGAASAAIASVTGTKTTNPDGSDGAVSAGSTGWFYVDLKPSGSAALTEVLAEIVLVDTGTSDDSTVSGKREFATDTRYRHVLVESVAP